MPIRFTQGDIAFLFKKLGMAPLRKGSTIYGGIGPDGVFRTCKLDYHSDKTPVATGTANAIAKALGFKLRLRYDGYLICVLVFGPDGHVHPSSHPR